MSQLPRAQTLCAVCSKIQMSLTHKQCTLPAQKAAGIEDGEVFGKALFVSLKHWTLWDKQYQLSGEVTEILDL